MHLLSRLLAKIFHASPQEAPPTGQSPSTSLQFAYAVTYRRHHNSPPRVTSIIGHAQIDPTDSPLDVFQDLTQRLQIQTHLHPGILIDSISLTLVPASAPVPPA